MSGNAVPHPDTPAEKHDARGYLRKRSLLPATLVTEQGSVDCRVLDFSTGGAKLECAEAPDVGGRLTLMIEAVGTFAGRVIWRHEAHAGVRFDTNTGTATTQGGSTVLTPMPSVVEPPAPAPEAEATPDAPVEQGLQVEAVANTAGAANDDGATAEEPAAGEPPLAPPVRPKQRHAKAIRLKPDGEEVFALPAGQPLFRTGDPGGRMYLLRAGKLEVQDGDREHEEIESGAIVGELELLEKDLKRRTTVVALTDCELMEIDGRRFRALIEKRPDFALMVMHTLSGRLRHMGDLPIPDSDGIPSDDQAARAPAPTP